MLVNTNKTGIMMINVPISGVVSIRLLGWEEPSAVTADMLQLHVTPE